MKNKLDNNEDHGKFQQQYEHINGTIIRYNHFLEDGNKENAFS